MHTAINIWQQHLAAAKAPSLQQQPPEAMPALRLQSAHYHTQQHPATEATLSVLEVVVVAHHHDRV